MARGDKSSYTDKQKRQAEHIEEGYEKSGVSKDEAEARAWATVNKETGGGKKSGSGRGKPVNRSSSRKGGRKAAASGKKKSSSKTSRSSGLRSGKSSRSSASSGRSGSRSGTSRSGSKKK